MSDDKAKPAINPINPKDELSKDELDKVAGGAPAHASAKAADKPALSEITISKVVDKASPP